MISVDQENSLSENGFQIVENIYTSAEIAAILSEINLADTSKDTFRRSADLFAIRQFLKEVPAAVPLIFNAKLKALIQHTVGDNYFAVRSIYFDKPETSNWYVAYHQDLTISVKEKLNIAGFGPWTVKQNQFAVQPPLDIMKKMLTVRVHLDDATQDNGALRVIAGSHLKGIYRPETINWNNEEETLCPVPKGGVMLMKPLLLHSSGRTVNGQKRRVIHIELSNLSLPDGLEWAEKMKV